MQWGIGAHRVVKALHLALLVEEAVLVALGDEEVELEVAARELHVAGDGRPLAESDGFALGGAVGQRIAADEVLLQHVSEREEVWLWSHLSEMPVVLAVVRHHTALRLYFHHTALRLYGVNCASRV